jgi:hypothetical protein
MRDGPPGYGHLRHWRPRTLAGAPDLVGKSIDAGAGVDPLPAGWRPDLLPAIVPVGSVAVVVRYVVVRAWPVNEMPAGELGIRGKNLPAQSDAAESVPMECHGRRRRDNCRPYRDRGNAPPKFGHHFDLLRLGEACEPDARGIAKSEIAPVATLTSHAMDNGRPKPSFGFFVALGGKSSAAHGAKFAGELKEPCARRD